MSKTSPTQRALAECKRRGWPAQVVERFNSFTKRRHDLFGCIDIVAISPAGIVGIQATSGQTGGNHSARVAKAKAQPHLGDWLKHAQFVVWSFAKRGPRGKAKHWTLREEAVQP